MDGDTRNPWIGVSILLFMVSVCLVVALLSTGSKPASSPREWMRNRAPVEARTLREMRADQEQEEMQWRVRQIHALQAQEAMERNYSRLRR